MDIGLPELLIVAVIVLLLFGSTRLPQLSHSVGESLKELRNGMAGTPTSGKKTASKQKDSGNTKA